MRHQHALVQHRRLAVFGHLHRSAVPPARASRRVFSMARREVLTSNRLAARARPGRKETRMPPDRLGPELLQHALATPWFWVALACGVAMFGAAVWLLLRQRRSHRLSATVIAELQQSQNELQNQTRILQSVLDSMSDGVAVADEHGRLVIFNPAGERTIGAGIVRGGPRNWSEHFGLFLPDQATPYPPEELPLARAV